MAFKLSQWDICNCSNQDLIAAWFAPLRRFILINLLAAITSLVDSASWNICLFRFASIKNDSKPYKLLNLVEKVLFRPDNKLIIMPAEEDFQNHPYSWVELSNALTCTWMSNQSCVEWKIMRIIWNEFVRSFHWKSLRLRAISGEDSIFHSYF